MKILTGNALEPVTTPAIIAHIVNDSGGWGAGFVKAISSKWSAPEKAYREWYEAVKPLIDLGQTQLVEVESDIWVANMCAQAGWTWNKNGIPPIRYEALARAFSRVTQEAELKGANIHMPRIGCGLAGGNWEEVSATIDNIPFKNEIYVYDLP